MNYMNTLRTTHAWLIFCDFNPLYDYHIHTYLLFTFLLKTMSSAHPVQVLVFPGPAGK